jgi:hypothetical protein
METMMTAARLTGALILSTFGLVAIPMTGCGSDSGNKPTSGTGGGSNQNDNKSQDAGPTPPPIPEGSVGCGQKVCAVPQGTTGMACCIDAFSAVCGVNTGNGMGCTALPKQPPPGCPPLPAVMGFMTTACCTSMGQCGVDLSFIGQGCVDIAVAAQRAMAMGIDVGQSPPEATCTPGDGGA